MMEAPIIVFCEFICTTYVIKPIKRWFYRDLYLNAHWSYLPDMNQIKNLFTILLTSRKVFTIGIWGFLDSWIFCWIYKWYCTCCFRDIVSHSQLEYIRPRLRFATHFYIAKSPWLVQSTVEAFSKLQISKCQNNLILDRRE